MTAKLSGPAAIELSDAFPGAPITVVVGADAAVSLTTHAALVPQVRVVAVNGALLCGPDMDPAVWPGQEPAKRS